MFSRHRRAIPPSTRDAPAKPTAEAPCRGGRCGPKRRTDRRGRRPSPTDITPESPGAPRPARGGYVDEHDPTKRPEVGTPQVPSASRAGKAPGALSHAPARVSDACGRRPGVLGVWVCFLHYPCHEGTNHRQGRDPAARRCHRRRRMRRGALAHHLPGRGDHHLRRSAPPRADGACGHTTTLAPRASQPTPADSTCMPRMSKDQPLSAACAMIAGHSVPQRNVSRASRMPIKVVCTTPVQP
jgi:hypothetical protein